MGEVEATRGAALSTAGRADGACTGATLSGWIKFEKDLATDPRVMRMAKALDRLFHFFEPSQSSPDGSFDPCNASALPAVTLVCGALARLWIYADSHAREDDTLDLGASEIDELLGIPGFCSLMPNDWLREIDENTVELPGFQEHNGVEAKKRALTQKRVARHRDSKKPKSVTTCNASSLPDQDQTKTRLDQQTDGAVAPLPAKASESKKRPSRRCPSDFTVTDDLKTWASTECPGVDILAQTKAFRDYEFRNSHTDWPATWRTWMRKAQENLRANGKVHEPPRARAFPS